MIWFHGLAGAATGFDEEDRSEECRALIPLFLLEKFKSTVAVVDAPQAARRPIATEWQRLPFGNHNYFASVRLHFDTAARVAIVSRQPPSRRRFVATINAEAFFYEPLLRPPHVGRKRRQVRFKFFDPVVWVCRHCIRPVARFVYQHMP